MARWTTLSNAITGNILAKATPSFEARWEWITDTVAGAFDCEAEDLECLETDEGEFVTLNGDLLVEIHEGNFNGARAVVFADAAE